MYTTLSVRQLFLIDSIGAAVTALMLGLLLTTFEPAFGMPPGILFPLAGVAACFAAYSLTCYVRALGHEFLLGIAIANALYCGCTLGLIIVFRESLTWLGVAYFVGEILVIATLVTVETTVARRAQKSRPSATRQPR